MRFIKIAGPTILSWVFMCLAGYTTKNTAGTDMSWWGFPTFLFLTVFCVVAALYAIISALSSGDKNEHRHHQ